MGVADRSVHCRARRWRDGRRGCGAICRGERHRQRLCVKRQVAHQERTRRLCRGLSQGPMPADPFEQRWSVWAAGYGGSQTTDGNAALGSNNTTSSLGGVAVGADYRFSPNTIAGFALAGGATNFSVNGLGSGRSDLFQAGAFVRHTVGAGLSHRRAGLWLAGRHHRSHRDHRRRRSAAREIQRQRLVGPRRGRLSLCHAVDRRRRHHALRGRTVHHLRSARLCRTGDRRRQHLCAETMPRKNVTDTRSELGLRSDKSFAMTNGIFTLRGRAAWAHDFNTDRTSPRPSRRCPAHPSSSTAPRLRMIRRSSPPPPK